ncbi:MAG: hypothetical protein HUK24_07360 [Sphaerochaetaceae bacterium]|nr:hypothetical protein [Sphaerochaetaceae bacterium]
MTVVDSPILSYCNGVSESLKIAVSTLEQAKKRGLPCYSIGPLIHNKDVVSFLEDQGIKVIHSPENVEPGFVIIRAHGVSDVLRRSFKEKGFIVVDATCPIVSSNGNKLRKAASEGSVTIVVGTKDHAETIGLLGVETKEGEKPKHFLVSSKEDVEKISYSFEELKEKKVSVIFQTTFPIKQYNEVKKALELKIPDIVFLNHLCIAPSSRKEEAMKALETCDCAVVVGGFNSENSKDLCTYLKTSNKLVVQVENAKSFKEEDIKNIGLCKKVLLCSGSSTPMVVIDEVRNILLGL